MAGSEDNAPPKPAGDASAAGKAAGAGVHQRPTPVKGVDVADLKKAAPQGLGVGTPAAFGTGAAPRTSLFGGAPAVPATTAVRKSIVPPPPGAKPLAAPSAPGMVPPPRPSGAGAIGLPPKVPSLASPTAGGPPTRASVASMPAVAAGAAMMRSPPVPPGVGKPPPGAPIPLSAFARMGPPAAAPVPNPPPAEPKPAVAPAPKPAENTDAPELELDALADGDLDASDAPEVSTELDEEEAELSYSDRPTGEVPAASASDRPTREIPAPIPSTPRAVAPPPPRLPTLGPEPEFSFDISSIGSKHADVPALEHEHDDATREYSAAALSSATHGARAQGIPDIDFSFGAAAAPAPPAPTVEETGDPLAGLSLDDPDPVPAKPAPLGARSANVPPVPAAPPKPAIEEIEVDFEDPVSLPPPNAPVVPARSLDVPPAAAPVGKPKSPPENFSTSFAAVQPPAPNPRRELEERFALGDYSGALVIAEALMTDQGDDPVVKRITADCRARLTQMYQSRLGSMDQIPVVAVSPGELRWMSLDHRAGFVLSLIDGFSSVEELLDLAGMPALDVLRTLYELLAQRVIELKARPGNRR